MEEHISLSNDCDVIEASIEKVNETSTRRKRYTKRKSIPRNASMSQALEIKQKTIKEASSTSAKKFLSPRITEQKSGIIKESSRLSARPFTEEKHSNPIPFLAHSQPQMHSKSLFSDDNRKPSIPITESPIFNRQLDYRLSGSEANYLPDFEAQIFQCPLDGDLQDLSSAPSTHWEGSIHRVARSNSGKSSSEHLYHISPKRRRDSQNVEPVLSKSSSQRQRNSPMIHCSQSVVALNEAFGSPVHESNHELSHSDYSMPKSINFNDDLNELSDSSQLNESMSFRGSLNDEHDTLKSDGRCESINFHESVNELMRTQELNQSLLNQQSNQISTQLRYFECFVREKIEKIEAAEDYVKEKLTQIEDSNLVIVEVLKEMKGVERQKPVRSQTNRVKRTDEMVMPKIPVSKEFTLVILNSALEDANYMKVFVAEVSDLVPLTERSCRELVKSVMTKLFTLNLLIKYRWSFRTPSNKPRFSTLTNVLRALARLLKRHMSKYDMCQYIREFFNEIPRMHKRKTR